MNAVVASGQVRESFGEIGKTIATIVDYCGQAEQQNAQLICFPECYLQGYELNPDFIKKHALATNSNTFCQFLSAVAHVKLAMVVGFIEEYENHYFNAAAIIHSGQLIDVYRKQSLMRMEQRIFSAGNTQRVYCINGLSFAVAICKDLNLDSVYKTPKDAGASLLVAPCNNMLMIENAYLWEHKHNQIRQQHCKNANIALLSADVTGKRSDRVALGPTALINGQGDIIDQVPAGKEQLFCVSLRDLAASAHFTYTD